MVPIVSSNRKNGNACQHSPEHGNKIYERGGTCTPVQPYISGIWGGAHPGVPGGSNSIHQYGEGQRMLTQPRAWE